MPEPDLVVVRGTWRDYKSRYPEPADTALVVEVAYSSLSEDRALAAHLRDLGGDCTLEAVKDSGGFGRSRLQDGDEGEAKSDTTVELAGKVESPTLTWATFGI